MSKLIKLTILFLLTAIFFTWNVEVIILLLNHSTRVNAALFPQMFLDLFLFYGPLWIVFAGLIFFVVQFFAEKKYKIGFVNPPTLIYLFTFTVFLITLISFLNYDYYSDFFTSAARTKLNLLLLANSLLIFIGAVFFFLKKRIKHGAQAVFFCILLLHCLLSYHLVNRRDFTPIQQTGGEMTAMAPRKLKIIIMEGLSLDFILNLSTSKKLLNFDWIRQNGVVGRIRTFHPNFDLSLLNSLLSGQPPSAFKAHANSRYQFRDLNAEFDIFPRYIFFRNSARLRLVTFYKKDNYAPADHIRWQYEAARSACFSLIAPASYPVYSEKNLLHNNTFLQFFSDIAGKKSGKATILKKTFYLDEFLLRRIPNFKITDLQYFIINLPGLDVVTTHFYHYAYPQDFRNISPEQAQEYGTILEKYYLYYDSVIGKMITTMADDEMLVILSLFEAEPLPLWRRIFLNYIGKKDIFVYKPNSSPGLVLFYEKKALKKQFFLNSLSIYDLYPTLIYYAGFPLSKSLKGELLREIFDERFIRSNPIITLAD